MSELEQTEVTVSVILPVKNEAVRLPRSLQSVRNLEGDSIREIIVVDNGSADDSVAVASSLSAIVLQKAPGNISAVRNMGASVAQGKFLLFVDADVEVDPQFLLNGLRHFRNPSVGIVTGFIGIPESNTWVERTWALNRSAPSAPAYVSWASSMNMLIRRDVFTAVGGFSEDFVTYEDMDLCERVKAKGYLILTDPAVRVVHFGEARSLVGLFRKERWRGNSAWDFFTKYSSDRRNARRLAQIVLFGASVAAAAMSTVTLAGVPLILSASAALSLPLARAIVTSVKVGRYDYLTRLTAVWFFYYAGRTMAMLDRLVARGT